MSENLNNFKKYATELLMKDTQIVIDILRNYGYLVPAYPTSYWTFIRLKNYIENINNTVLVCNSVLLTCINQFKYKLNQIKNIDNVHNEAKENVLVKYRKKISEIDIVIAQLQQKIVDYDADISNAQEDGNWGRYELYSEGWSKVQEQISKLRALREKYVTILEPSL